MSAPTGPRSAAFETLRRVFEDDAWADRALRAAAERRGLTGRDRARAQSLAYGAVQRRGSCDHVAEKLAGRRMKRIDPPLRAALRLGLYELLFTAADGEHAIVDQAVGLAKGKGGRRRGSGMVNAVLRRAARERAELKALFDPSRALDPAAASIVFSIPEWIAALWWEQLGDEAARSLLAAINEPPERAFRVVERHEATTALDRLRTLGVDAIAGDLGPPPHPAGSIVVHGGDWGAVEDLVGSGDLVPQSRASAMVGEILAARPGERVLDLCAGPGIKAGQIATALGGGAGLVAVERDEGRARELAAMLAALGAGDAEVVCADAVDFRPPQAGFDAVLVDPPCSGLGTLASRPDSRWRRGPEEIERMAALAERILETAARSVRPGGRIVYSTCTISAAENEGVVERALSAGGLTPVDLAERQPTLASPSDGRFLQTRNDRDGTDGFFVAELRREA